MVALLQVLRRSRTEERLPKVLRSLDIFMVGPDIALREREVPLEHEVERMSSTVRYAKMLAKKRGIDSDLASVAGALQNLGRIITGRQEGHAESGYLPTRIFLRELGFFRQEEIEQIAQAVRNHSKKETTGSPLEELVKDTDIFSRYCAGLEITRPAEIARLAKIRKELNF